MKEIISRKKSRSLWETVRTILYAVLIALIVRTVAFEPFNIPSGSMKPTLLVGDYVFVSKYSYGYSRYSFSLPFVPPLFLPFDPPLFSGRVFFTEPERGDVVVFKLPRDNETDYIKRIIGLPKDRIQVRGGVLYINGEPVDRQPVGDGVRSNGTGGMPWCPEALSGSWTNLATEYLETLPGGKIHPIIEVTDCAMLDDTDVYRVPEGHYFVMGDNRDNSADSRGDGRRGWFVPAENLVGRAEILFFSTNGRAQLWEFWKWPSAIRFGRFFKTIE